MVKSMLEIVAESEAIDASGLSALLDAHGIDLRSEGTAESHRLRITRIRFAGTKEHVEESGPFVFERSFSAGCVAVASDKNLTGKTSVIAITKWALRGSPDDDVSNVVRGWLSTVEVDGMVDGLPFFIIFDPVKRSGTLTVGSKDATSTTSFSSQTAFVSTMNEFFERHLGLPKIPSFRKDANGGTKISHGWPAYLGTIWISDAKEDLLLGETTFAALPQRLLNMFVAVPWAEASFALNQAESKCRANADFLAVDHGADERKARASAITSQINAIRIQAPNAPDLVSSSAELKAATLEWRKAEAALGKAQSGLAQIVEEHNHAAAELRLIEREAAAGRVFSGLQPSRCPRCSNAVAPLPEDDGQSCYVCTHAEPVLAQPPDNPTPGLKKDVDVLFQTKSDLNSGIAGLTQSRDKAATRMDDARASLDELSSSGAITNLIEVARLEGELGGIDQNFGNQKNAERAANEADQLKSIRTIVERVRRQEAVRRFESIDALLPDILQSLGFTDATEAHLSANGGLNVTYSDGTVTPFKGLQDGEKVRARLATIIAMLRCGGGRHPGLIVYDSLANKEVNPADLSKLLGALKEVANRHGVQVIVTHQGHDVAVAALGHSNVISPSSHAGHIF